MPVTTTIAMTAVEGPFVTGFRQRWVFIPQMLVETLPPDALRDVLLHEIAHVRRGDLGFAALQRCVLTVFWWSPWLRYIGRELDRAREMACDRRAAARSSGIDYADSLVTSVERLLVPEASRAAFALAILATHYLGMKHWAFVGRR